MMWNADIRHRRFLGLPNIEGYEGIGRVGGSNNA
jgi:hypothetical protein